MGFTTTLENVSFIASLVITAVLGVLVYKLNPRSATNRLFVLLCTLTFIWMVAVHFSLLENFSSGFVLTWIRISVAMAMIQTTLLFLFVHTMPKTTIHLSKRILYSVIFSAIIIVGLCLSPYAFSSLEFTDNFPSPKPGPAFGIVVIFGVSLVAVSIYLLLKKYRNATGIQRQQFLFVLVGTILMYSSIIVTIALPILFFRYSRFAPYKSLYSLFFFLPTAYAITRYRLMDVRLMIRKGLIVSLVTIASLTAATSFLLLIKKLLANYVTVSDDILVLLSVIVLMMIFPKMKQFVQDTIDRYIFTDFVDLSVKVREFEKAAPQSNMLEELAERTAHFIQQNIKEPSVQFLVYDHVTKDRLISCWPYRGDIVLQLNDPLLQVCQADMSIAVEEEFKEVSDKTSLQKNALRRLEMLKAHVAVPIGERDKMYGLLLIGSKMDHQPFTTHELSYLAQLARSLTRLIPQVATVEILKKKAAEVQSVTGADPKVV